MRPTPDSRTRNALELPLADDTRESPLAAPRIYALCVQNGLPPEIAFDVNLAVDGPLTNTITYSHDDDRKHRVELIFRFNRDEVMVQITDDGEPFDPLQAPDPDTEAPLKSQAKEGSAYFSCAALWTASSTGAETDATW